jgi:pilus assembly protein FimV
VAKINPVKVKQDAEKEEKAGRFDKAITLYRQLVDDNPRDWNTVKKIGDLYTRLNKVKEAASEYAKVANYLAQDGFLLKAIALWKQINKLDASALEPYLNLADLYAKQGLMVEAKGQYQIVLDEYIKRGRVREAGDALKKMAEIDPADLKVRSKLADLYTRDGNATKAVEEHIAIADELNKKGHLAEALQVLEKGLKIDPKSSRLRVELARIHLVQKNYDKAIHFLEEASRQSPKDKDVALRLGEAYLGARRVEEADGIFRRLLQQDPQDQEARTLMGRMCLMQGQFDRAYEQLLPVVDRLLERKEGERAASLLQQIVQRNPAHVKSLLKLVEVYRQLRKDSAVPGTYSQIVEAYINQGQMDQAASVLEILVGLEPQNEQHRNKLEFVRSKKGGRPTAPAAPAPVVEEDFELAGPEATSAPSAPAPAAPASGPRAAIQLSGPLSEEDQEFINEHLAEGRVFRKYGLVDKARDQLEAVIVRFADNVEARQELRDVFKEKGENEKAAEQSRLLAEIFRLKGDAAAAETHAAEARQLSPPPPAPAPAAAAAPAAAPPAPKAAPRKEPAPAPAPPPPDPVEEEIPLEVEEGGLDAPALDQVPEPDLQALDLGMESGAEGELTGHFLEEEPSQAAEPATEIDVPVDVEGGAELEEEISLGIEEETPLLEPPPPAPAKKAPARPAPEPPRPAPVPPPPVAAAPRPVAPPPRPVAPPPKPSRIVPKPAALPMPPPTAKKPAPPPKAPPAPPPSGGIPAELQKVLDEVESYISLGFVDDAKEALSEIGERYSGHPAIARKMAELGLDEAKIPPPPSRPRVPSAPPPDEAADLVDEPPLRAEVRPHSLLDDPLGELGLDEPEPAPPPAEEGGLDLGAELGGLFGAQSAVEEPVPASGTDLGDAGLADIFKEFKKGVDKQLGKEDYDTRYNLGIAYKEMGLIDEAIAEFQLAAKDENRLLECSSMLGICFLEKGMAKLAVKWFEKGLTAPDRSEEEYQGLRYDLASALEAAGDTDKALHVFTDLYGQDANFRDVATKVRDLRAALR